LLECQSVQLVDDADDLQWCIRERCTWRGPNPDRRQDSGANERQLAARFDGENQFAILMRVPVLLGTTMTPDLRNESMRLFEWPDNAVP
jgi:hypothetical protein